jgi:hypothetical protein
MTYLFYGDIGHEPRLDPPDPDPAPRCPVCGQEAITFYIADHDVIGCDCCVATADAVDYADAHGF